MYFTEKGSGLLICCLDPVISFLYYFYTVKHKSAESMYAWKLELIK